MLKKIAWKNILYKPLNTVLCVSLLLFGVGIISLLLVIQQQLEQKFDRDLQDIDLVLGAKGSPLQLVLSAVYHLDAPTGNIQFADARRIMEAPLVEEAIPLAYGDTYQGYRILGTTEAYLKKYDAQFREGRLFSKALQAVIGSDVAEKTGLSIGATFIGTHGDARSGDVHDDHPYTVVGILDNTNTVLDQLLLTNLESVWEVHAHPEHDDEHEHEHDDEHEHNHDDEHEHDHDDEHEHDHDDEHEHEHDDEHEHLSPAIIADSMEVTAVLLQYKSKIASVNMPRHINEQTNMQAVIPALEINRLFYMLGVGATTLKLIAGGIMLLAGFSVFFVLFSRLRERKFELALMRTVGYRPQQLFGLLVLEGTLLALVGYVLGWILSRIGLYVVNQQAEGDFNIHFSGAWVEGEAWLLLVTLLVGVIAALLPAWQAMQMNISAVMSEN
ncbi:MAG: FtsX-like permease family protein [Bacteroidota bacterium]